MSFAESYGFLLVQVNGRGNCFYDGLGETDVFEVLADLRAKYTLDEDRLYVEGSLMGATGAYRLGVRFPDIFAAVGGCDGFADYREWYTQYYGPFWAIIRRKSRPAGSRTWPWPRASILRRGRSGSTSG